MFTVEADTIVKASPETILEFVMDLDRYKAADRKIRHVKSIERHGNEAIVTTRNQLRGLPIPARQRITLTPGKSIEVRNTSSWADHLADFTGTFTCEPVPTGTKVTHRYDFDVYGPLRYPFERLFRRWLDRQIHEEVALIKQILELPPAASRIGA